MTFSASFWGKGVLGFGACHTVMHMKSLQCFGERALEETISNLLFDDADAYC